jgi:hypothetical protein
MSHEVSAFDNFAAVTVLQDEGYSSYSTTTLHSYNLVDLNRDKDPMRTVTTVSRFSNFLFHLGPKLAAVEGQYSWYVFM